MNYTPSSVKNLTNTIAAFHWALPDSFWRQRVDEEIFFELEDIRKSQTRINLQFVRLDLTLLSLKEGRKYGLQFRCEMISTLRNLMSVYQGSEMEEPSLNPTPPRLEVWDTENIYLWMG
jgi:hypothetical protein